MTARSSIAQSFVVAAAAVLLVTSVGAMLSAQRRGGGRGGEEARGEGAEKYPLTRLQILEADFKLKKEQKKVVKRILDEAHNDAAPIRGALAETRTAIAVAVEANKPQAEIDAAVQSYAEQAAAMTALEMSALAKVLKALDEEQRANSAGIRSAFFLMRGMFLDAKRWDDVPDYRSY
jgi:Spy/CpxP family protein refolding chaperone